MLKRFISLLLCALLFLSIVGCSAQESTATETGQAETLESSDNKQTKETEEAEEVEEFDMTVENPLTPEDLAAIPIANSSMSIDELRQICIDFVCLQVSFPWKANQTLTYKVDTQNYDADYVKGKIYGGIPYVNLASGNLYRILDFYNSETGELNLNLLGTSKDLFGTACSGTACWGWSRVINSAELSYTSGFTLKKGAIPLGPYTYDTEIETFSSSEGKLDCDDIAIANGEQTMYQSYAKLLPADGIVSRGHVRMVKEAPNIVYKEDGVTIDGEKSTVLTCEQGLYSYDTEHTRYQSDGTSYQIQGNDNLKVSFASLFKSYYLPFTFAEFLGTDPVEPSSVTLDRSGENLTTAELNNSTVQSNYNISDIYFKITDENGNVILNYAKRLPKHYLKSYALSAAISISTLNSHADKNYNIEISVQISTGERPVIYSGKLMK